MNFNGQFDSNINPMILDVSKYNLGRHLEEINEECCDRILELTEQLAAQEGVDEVRKARNQFLRIQRMNSLRQRAEEIVMEDVLYSLQSSGAVLSHGRQHPLSIFDGFLLIPASGTAIDGIFAFSEEGLHAMPAQAQRPGFIRQGKCKHHLYAQQQ